MPDFKEVSLGFAEFVSQLIQETFDAMVSASIYQMERYAELVGNVSMANDLYAKKFFTEEEISKQAEEYFGVEINLQTTVDENLQRLLEENFENYNLLFSKKKLTKNGTLEIYNFISDMMAEQQKSMINALINNSGASKIVVDSGEITAKLELSNLYSTETEEKVEEKKTDNDSRNILLPGNRKMIKVHDIKDSKTGKNTIIIDRKEIENIKNSSFQIPALRLSVQPAKISGSSNLYSEIKINFKTV